MPPDGSRFLYRLLQTVERIAAREIRDPARRGGIVDRVALQLTRRVLRGRPPEKPEPWIRKVLRTRARAAPSREPLRFVPPHELDEIASLDPGPAAPNAPDRTAARARLDALEPRLFLRLTGRQREVYRALRTEPTIKAAARRAGLAPRDVRRYLRVIAGKAADFVPPTRHRGGPRAPHGAGPAPGRRGGAHALPGPWAGPEGCGNTVSPRGASPGGARGDGMTRPMGGAP